MAFKNGENALLEKSYLDRVSEAVLKAIALYTSASVLAGSLAVAAACEPDYLLSLPAIAACLTIFFLACLGSLLVSNALGGPMEARFDRPGKIKRSLLVVIYALCIFFLISFSLQVVIDAWFVSSYEAVCAGTHL